MAKTTVVNKKSGQPYDVYIGRGSDWGNPFKIGPDQDRATVVARYRDYIAGRPDLLVRLGELRGKRLACFCAPLTCHGDVLAELADAQDSNESTPTREFHVALTGHRPGKLAGYDLDHPFYTELRRWLAGIIALGLDKHPRLVLHSGMALGADTVWAQAILDAREQFGVQRIGFVAEVPVMTQPQRWRHGDQVRWRELIDAADQVNVYAQNYHVSCLHLRNEGMVNAADLVLAVWDGQPGGGTAAAVAYAEKTGTTVFPMPPARVRERAGLA